MNQIVKDEIQQKFIFGLDLGQTNDYTALLVLDRKQRVIDELVCTVETPGVLEGRDWHPKQTFEDAIYSVRYIERMRNLPYNVMIERVKQVIENPEIKKLGMLVLDRSGVGRPVYDEFVKAGLAPYGISITGGSADTVGGTSANVAKQNLVAIVQVISQAKDPDRLQYAKGLADLDLLRNEIGNFRVHVSKSQNEQYDAREGTHDDLILALALGLWFGERRGNPKRKNTSHAGY